jgi:flagellar biosynthesis protein FlhG
MKDQAERLRRIISNLEKDVSENRRTNRAKVLAVTSGKGGVGKTNVAVNFAISLRLLGYKVLILDVDFGLANVDIITGTNVKNTISDCIKLGLDIEEVINEGPEGIKIISGGSGFYELSIMNEENIDKFLNLVEKLESTMDFIIIDTGAGVSNTVLKFVMAAEEAIIVTTPEPTSIMDSYTMIKALILNGYKGKLNILANIVNSRREAYSIYNKLETVSQNYLNCNLNFIGYIEKSDTVTKAVRNQTPFILFDPKDSISKSIKIMALKFAEPNRYMINQPKSKFTDRLKKLLFSKR